MQIQPAKMRSPGDYRGGEQGAQASDDSDANCEKEDVVHERFFFKTRTIARLVPATDWRLPDLRRIVRPPAALGLFQPLNLARALIDPVAIDYWTRIAVSTAFGSVIFAENKLKISVVYFLSSLRDTIQ
jgi:hypothetical protein